MVAIDATPLLDVMTGVGEFCLRAMGALALRGDLDVSAYAVSWRRRHGLVAKVPPGVAVRDRPMPARPLNKSWSFWPLPPVELLIGAADVVHGTNFVVPPTWRAAAVVTVHDLTPVRFPEMCRAATLAYPGLVKKALRRGAWVHTPTWSVAEEVVEVLGAPPERVRAVHHGLAPPLLLRQPAGGAALQGPPVLAHAAPVAPGLLPPWVEKYVLAVGTVEPRKDFPTLVRAFDLIAGDHPELALVIAGPDGWGTAALDDVVAASPWRDRVVRPGWVADATRDALIAGAVVLACSSRYEGFGFPPLQAMALGTPVVATRCGALVEVLGEDASFVDVGDHEALAAALDRLLCDDGPRAELARRGQSRAEKFTWEASAAGLAQLYRDAVDNR